MEANSNIQEVYRYVTTTLSLGDRLQLTALILNDLTQPNLTVIDRRDTWTDEDRADITAFSLSYAANLYADAEELV